MKNDKLVLGTVQFGLPYGINNDSGMPSLENVFSILGFAKDNNIHFLDTAVGYGFAEERIGKFHSNNPTKIFEVNTKFSKGRIKDPLEQVISSIERLKVSFINTIMFHSLYDYINNRDKIALLFKESKDIHFKKFGVSVYTVEELEILKNIEEIEVVQVSFNLLDNESKKGAILSELKILGKEIHVRSCFLQGLFFKSTEKLTGKLKSLSKYLNIIKTIAKENNLSTGQLALCYCLSKPYIDYVLIGVDSKEQLQQNMNWASKNLNKNIVSEVDRIDINDEELLNPSKW